MKTVSKICKTLMIKEPYYGFFFLGLNKKFSSDLPTAGVYKQNLNFALDINKEFWYNLPEDHRYGIIKHELLHLVFFHLYMRKDFADKELFNIAADMEVNQYIDRSNLPTGCIFLDTFNIPLPVRAGTKVYYELLDQNLKSDNPDKNLKAFMDQMKSGKGMPGGMSSHDFWEMFDGLSETEKKLLKSQLEYQMKESAKNVKGRGYVPGEIQQTIDELFKQKESVFNWKAYFRRLMGTSYKIFTKKTYRKPSKRFEDSAGLKIKKKQRILVGIDTSGSVSEAELVDFFSEINHIYRAGVSVHIIECDACIHRQYEYKGKFDGTVSGRGGTEFKPIIDYYNNHLQEFTTLIYFTDGECYVKDLKPKKSMIWVLSSGGYYNESEFPGYVIKIPPTKNE